MPSVQITSDSEKRRCFCATRFICTRGSVSTTLVPRQPDVSIFGSQRASVTTHDWIPSSGGGGKKTPHIQGNRGKAGFLAAPSPRRLSGINIEQSQIWHCEASGRGKTLSNCLNSELKSAFSAAATHFGSFEILSKLMGKRLPPCGIPYLEERRRARQYSAA